MLLEKDWGLIRSYAYNQSCTVKMIVIAPGRSTSLHFHHLRDDMWIILDDGIQAQVGDKISIAKAGDEFIISAGVLHRLTAGEKAGRVLEIDFGFTSEDDTFSGGDEPGSD